MFEYICHLFTRSHDFEDYKEKTLYANQRAAEQARVELLMKGFF